MVFAWTNGNYIPGANKYNQHKSFYLRCKKEQTLKKVSYISLFLSPVQVTKIYLNLKEKEKLSFLELVLYYNTNILRKSKFLL